MGRGLPGPLAPGVLLDELPLGVAARPSRPTGVSGRQRSRSRRGHISSVTAAEGGGGGIGIKPGRRYNVPTLPHAGPSLPCSTNNDQVVSNLCLAIPGLQEVDSGCGLVLRRSSPADHQLRGRKETLQAGAGGRNFWGGGRALQAWGRKKSGKTGRAQVVGDSAAGHSSTQQGRPHPPL